MRLLCLLALLVLFPAVAFGQGDRPNILWITTEDMSPALGAYGDPEAATPHIDRLAEGGIRYTRAYSSAPICAPMRSALITGVHATSLGTMHLRMPMTIPESIPTLPEILREAGYFTTNNVKTDYNFSAEGRWHENSAEAHWRDRPDGMPFFSVFNFMITHEGPANRETQEEFEGLAERHDPDDADIPPYLPDSPEMRTIWARNYDLISVMDGMVGDLLAQLEADGLADDTIVFFFSDHGHGLPRHKRWLYTSGLHVPLIVHVPPRFRHLVEAAPGSVEDRLVSTVDVAPAVLSLAGVEIPAHMEGRAFLGPARTYDPDHLVFARDRADDVFDLARAAISDEYMYIRHFMPHRPYVMRAGIYGDQKTSYRELWRLREAGELDSLQLALFLPRPTEELYDLRTDPHQVRNLAGDPAHRDALVRGRTWVRDWMLETHDTALLPEPELLARARAHGATVYEMARSGADAYDVRRVLDAAERVGDPTVPVSTLAADLTDSDAAVRYWALEALDAHPAAGPEEILGLAPALLDDPAAAVAITAAGLVCRAGACEAAYPVLTRYLEEEAYPEQALFAAAVVRDLGEDARPLQPTVEAVLEAHGGDVWGRYRDWMYSMFIGFALDQTLVNLGAGRP